MLSLDQSTYGATVWSVWGQGALLLLGEGPGTGTGHGGSVDAPKDVSAGAFTRTEAAPDLPLWSSLSLAPLLPDSHLLQRKPNRSPPAWRSPDHGVQTGLQSGEAPPCETVL